MLTPNVQRPASARRADAQYGRSCRRRHGRGVHYLAGAPSASLNAHIHARGNEDAYRATDVVDREFHLRAGKGRLAQIEVDRAKHRSKRHPSIQSPWSATHEPRAYGAVMGGLCVGGVRPRLGGKIRLQRRELAVGTRRLHYPDTLGELLKCEASGDDSVTQHQSDTIAFGVASQGRQRMLKLADPRSLARIIALIARLMPASDTSRF